MKKSLLLFLILSAALLTGGERIVFSTPGTFHTAWRYIGKIPLIPRTVFSVVPSGNNGNSKLVVEARKSSGMMMQYLNVDLEKTPVMRWRWRVVTQMNWGPWQDHDDQPVVIYIGDGSALKQRSVGYRWEIHGTVGKKYIRNYSGGAVQLGCVTMRTAATPGGKWVTEERNVLKDFGEFFGGMKRKKALVIGGNSQHSRQYSLAEIDYIEFLSVEEAAARPIPAEEK